MARKPAKSLDSHERIRKSASTTLRRDGVGSLSVHRVMREAGMTVGGFYAHYASRDELVRDAFAAASLERRKVVAKVLGGVSGERRLLEFVTAYLARDHVEDLPGGCPWAAVLSDLPRTDEGMRDRVTEQFARSADGLSPDRRASIATLALSFASLILMRTVTDDGLREEIGEAARFAVERMVDKRRDAAPEEGETE